MPPPATHGLQQQIQTCPAMVLASLTTQAAAYPQALKHLCLALHTCIVRKPAGTEAAPHRTLLCLEGWGKQITSLAQV